ncbi:ABC transporter substrate-binding protein [Desulfofustis glycolicus]|uniref:Iron complex transport system substrate-binding protein n=1 Tax=Desulfofustis glycolicus DSM 9705 TaxID=1121409 RepID=A0A1M5YU82_9BACT|nr:ABC transporter substrate-binding protein [Desulfofustis glycolicus]MCB2215829.1 ABC transporter substrate-binding protein [Desulfobulbaceae bacterium]SHI15398.1 iron complex transport system substrate-binding protein [Desulfofustis glycolicus DSM 9705]
MNYIVTKLVMRKLVTLLLFVLICGGSAMAQEKREVVDQLGRSVTIPTEINRVVILMHHALDVALELGAQDKIVGVLSDWEKYLPQGFRKAWPQIDDVAKPGDLRTSVNAEELLKLRPDVVIITHYMMEKTGKQIEALGVPVVGLSFYKAGYEEASVLNPKLEDPNNSYTEGMKEGVRLLGDILDKSERAEQLLAHIFRNRQIIEDRVGNLEPQDRVTTYMAYPELFTMGTGKYASVIMERAGGINVAMEISGYKQVSMEEVLKWNPQVIFTQDRYKYIADEIKESPAWQAVQAVREGRIYVTPEYVKPWGHPCPESIGLGELWMAKKLYPDIFADIDIEAYVNDFYKTFYGIAYSGSH